MPDLSGWKEPALPPQANKQRGVPEKGPPVFMILALTPINSPQYRTVVRDPDRGRSVARTGVRSCQGASGGLQYPSGAPPGLSRCPAAGLETGQLPPAPVIWRPSFGYGEIRTKSPAALALV